MSDDKWYFNTRTGQVEQGKGGNWDDRMGPYDSADEARQALATAQARVEAEDEADAAWENSGFKD